MKHLIAIATAGLLLAGCGAPSESYTETYDALDRVWITRNTDAKIEICMDYKTAPEAMASDMVTAMMSAGHVLVRSAIHDFFEERCG